MVLNKNVLFFLICTTIASLECRTQKAIPSHFRATIARISEQTLVTGAQTADYLLYPFVCWFAGRLVYQGYISSKLPNAPQVVTSVESYLPGKDTARVGATHVAVGLALFAALKSFMRLEKVNTFVQTNMPHFAQIMAYLDAQKVEDTESADENPDAQIKIAYNPYTCR